MPAYMFYIIPFSSYITFLSSIALIAAKLTSTTSYNEATCDGQCKNSVAMLEDIPSPFLLLGIYPANLGLDASTLVLVAAHIALVVSFGIGIASGIVMRKGKAITVPRLRTLFVLLILFTTASLMFSTFVASFALHSKSSHFDLQYRSSAGGFGYANTCDNGVFDLESWTCAMKGLKSMKYYPELGRQCAAERAGRACVVIVAVFSIIMFVAVGWDVRKSRNFIEVEEGKEGELDDRENVMHDGGLGEGQGWRGVSEEASGEGEKIRYG